MNYANMSPEDVQRKKLEGLVHLRFVSQLYKDQIKASRYFLHEHPLSAMSWSEDCMREIIAMDGVGEAVCDQCMYGCKTKGTPTSPPMAARKATRFLSNGSEMLGRLNRRCDGSHEHKQLRGKELAEAAIYPAGLIHSIIQGRNLTHAADLLRRSNSTDHYPDPLCSAKRVNGYGTESKVLGTCKM